MVRSNVILEQGNTDEITVYCIREEYNINSELTAKAFPQPSEALGAKLPLITNLYNTLERFTITGYIKSADKLKFRRMMLGNKTVKYLTVDGTSYDGVSTELITASVSRVLPLITLEKLQIVTDAKEEQDELRVTFTAVVGQQTVKTA